jgi:hypothetical protein
MEPFSRIEAHVILKYADQGFQTKVGGEQQS